jgi:hypothetical protein
VILTWVWACRGPADPGVAAERVERVGPALQALAARRVGYLRHQDWCEALLYDRGHFADSSHPSTCTLDSSPHVPLDPTARTDLQGFLAQLQGAGLEPVYVVLRYDSAGAMSHAELLVPASWSLGSVGYVWAPAEPPEPLPAERVVTSLGGDWYLVQEDWN